MLNTLSPDKELKMKDLKSEDPRWCTGCGDYSILVGLRKLMVKHQLDPEKTINISGIGCSGRIPHYMDTYGFHTVHGRAIPIALGVRLAKPDYNLFIHSGDGDALSIGGNHLIHGIQKNFNCVFLLFDNQIYGLTKQQTSPTTRQGVNTMTQPEGGSQEPINPIAFALGLGASFVASTAEWTGQHFVDTLDKAIKHPGFSFVHIAQRCPKYSPQAWDYKDSSWMTFLDNPESGLAADTKSAPDAKLVKHDPTDLVKAQEFAQLAPDVFGLFYQAEKTVYDEVLRSKIKHTTQKDASKLLEAYSI